ncbi:hypothetical protein PACTADRAFT_5311 [Pachysolen tannophilus NRRL Y-2460]|uniref:THIF-type NAD/FAD binding fold domain-containing protein n=1 Tax=Pachysolen tannophilus NRRL Y-2460 TaxID=669874 RepID=A0A1E4TP90_PACTA|nr:hypothetical protein PACTADRAFT_5311 [Pachysolen tannophilus NRRL Y-2460]
MVENKEDNKTLSADEIALYDRQIRLWGIDAQTRIRSSKILIVNLSYVGVEIVKNLMLSGIGQLTIWDSSVVCEEDLDGNFFVNETHLGKLKAEASFNKIKDLNSRVKLNVITTELDMSDNDFFQKFDLIIGTELIKTNIVKLNGITRNLNIPFYSTGLHGLFGYIFVDLINYQSSLKIPKNFNNTYNKLGEIDSAREIVKMNQLKENDEILDEIIFSNNYKPFEDVINLQNLKLNEVYTTKRKLKKITPSLPIILTLFDYPLNKEKIDDVDIEFKDLQAKNLKTIEILKLNLKNDDEYLKILSKQAFCQFAPVSAILGGAVAQDVIQFLSGKNCFNNFVILDGIKSEMPIYIL